MKKVDEHTANVTHSSRYRRVVWIDRRIDGKFVRSIGPTFCSLRGLSRSRIRYSRFIVITNPSRTSRILTGAAALRIYLSLAAVETIVNGPVVRWIAIRWSLFHVRRAIAVSDLTNWRGSLSVDPGHRYPLRCRMNPLDGCLQLCDRLVDLVVHDGQVEEVAVRLLQRVRLFRQSFQASVALKRRLKIKKLVSLL